ncbi:ABC transporter permease [Tepidanaerobacter acetatoxydans]|uniref:ABC transporter permease n=1 Tax=Tepidanaerobacter acetatoxydans TaxID=499229 RepID=UPI001BD5F32D|nr:ABC transporter permease [Tepidanaerobacter acetatoxydans]
MDTLQTIKIALRGILDNKLRSFLTMLGIIIGVTSVIALVSIGQGATSQVTEQIQSLGSNLLTVNIMGRGANTTLSYKDAMEFAESPYISGVAPVVTGNATVKHGNKNSSVQIQGTNADFLTVRNYKFSQGRFITPADVNMRQKAAILGSQIAEDLFGLVNPIGQEVKIGGQIFKVVGILESSSSMMGSNDEEIYIPITVAERLLQSRGIRVIYIQAASKDTVSQATEEISSKLSRMFKTNPDSDFQSYRILDQTEMLDTINQTTGVLTMMLGGIAAISLLVGGIGIMNIMLVSVTERTREIGIRKALGARKRDIMSQFLIESLVISGIGGIIGIITGFLLSRGIAQLIGINAKTTYSVTAIAFGFSMMVGVFFGIYPANKASSLKPIEALRYE